MSDSAVKILSYSIDLDSTIGTTHLDTLFATGEKNAHRFELALHHGGVPVTLPASAAVAGSFVHCGSRETVDIAGSIEDNKIILTLKEACYLNSGKFTLAIDVTYGNVCATVFYGEGGITRSRTDNEASTPSTSDPILQSKSVTPSETAQTVRPDSGYDGLSSVSVGAISKTYVGSGVSRKTATTITPGTSDQSIAAGQYLSGKQTIKGDADLIPGNIRSGVEIFGVTGTYAASDGTADPVLQEKSVSPTTASQTVTPDSGYDGLSKVTVSAMPTATQATPSIAVDSAGKITASATQTAGYVSAGTKSATKQLTVQAAKTVTPTTTDQTAVASGRYTTGAVTVAGDANLNAANIKSGVSIFGVSGSYTGSGSGTSDPVLQEKSLRPGASGSTVRPDDGYDGLSVVYVTGDADLVASNIKSGVEIFGVTGTYTGESSSVGGLPTGISALASGVITPDSDITATHTIQHDLGVAPNFMTVMLMDTLEEAVPGMAIASIAFIKNGLPSEESLVTTEYYDTNGEINRISGSFFTTESIALITGLGADRALKAGYSYRWVCGVMDGIG